jgi:hypothetical protein
MSANPEIERYIYDGAVKRGIDPAVALEVARREALNVFDPSKPDYGGDDRSSFGVYQLHYGGLSSRMPNPGLGDEFTRKTGLDARDPSTWRQQVDFALDHAKANGWDAWMGAKAAGITGKMGIGGGGNASVASAFNGSVAAASAPALAAVPPSPLYPDMQQSYDTVGGSSPVGRRVSGDRRVAASPAAPVDDVGPESIPLDFARATPEAPTQQAAEPAAPAAPGGLAELFKVADIGQASAVDPITRRPVLARSRRTYG